jgi:hypothetical protein
MSRDTREQKSISSRARTLLEFEHTCNRAHRIDCDNSFVSLLLSA